MMDGYFGKLTFGDVVAALNNGPPLHPNCRCTWLEREQLDPKLEELGKKAAADILLHDKSRRIIVPSRDEWYGLNLIDRDS